MLSDDEIAELAQSIKEHGLIHPIVVDHDVLIDGRNRLKACEMAGVEPSFRPFPWNGKADGKEEAIIAYIVGENIRRRHLNAGQRAILVALAYPEPNTSGRASPLEVKGVNQGALSQARAIVKYCPDYVEEILAGIRRRIRPMRSRANLQLFRIRSLVCRRDRATLRAGSLI
jgi:hypothetical protein